MHVNKPTLIVLVGITTLSIAGMIFFEQDKAFYSISLALLVSSIFYVGTVIIPEVQRRNRIKNGLMKRYLAFKKSCIDIFLIASKSQDYQYRDNLLEPEEFKRYFFIRSENGQSRWDLVATSIDDGDYLSDELVSELEFLMREVSLVRSTIDLYDVKVEDFFSNLVQIIHKLRTTSPNSDDYKYFCRILLEIFAHWSLIDGQLEDDIFESMIEKI